MEAAIYRYREFARPAIVAWIAFLLTTAHVLEIVWNEVPCALCLMQRVWFMIAGLIAIAALADHRPRIGYTAGIITAAGIGSTVAIRQLYLQMNPEAAPTCGLDIDTMIEFRPLSQVLEAMTLGTGSCAEPSPIPFLALIGFVGCVVIALAHWRYRHQLVP